MKPLAFFMTICIASLMPQLAQAQSKQGANKKGAGMTCSQQCQSFCQNRHHNCFDACTTRRCNR